MTLDNHNPLLIQRLAQVKKRVQDAELQYGRISGSVQILPVSKTRPSEDIAELAHAGFQAFGESYLQEAEKKIAELSSLNLDWHFIGPIQSNKTQPIARLFHWVHSVDREKIARRLNDQRPEDLPPLNICLQLNISHEASKSGLSSDDDILELAARIIDFPNLKLRGIMAIPARTDDFEQQRKVFRKVSEIFTTLKQELAASAPSLDTLSMGMSNDLEAAIAEGSTIVRVGTDIFGPRT